MYSDCLEIQSHYANKKLLTVAGPTIETPFSVDILTSFLVRFSGMPSAMIAIARI